MTLTLDFDETHPMTARAESLHEILLLRLSDLRDRFRTFGQGHEYEEI